MDEAKIDSRQFQYDLAVANLNKPLMSGEREMNMNTYELMMEVARDMVVGLSAKKIASLIGKEIHPTVIMRLVEEALHDYKLEAIEKAKYDEEPEMVVKLKQAFKIFEAKK